MSSIWVLLTYIRVSFSIIIFVFDLFIFTPWISLSPASSCNICYSSCGVLAHMSMSSAKRRWLRYSPSILKPLVAQVSRRNMLSSAAVNSLGDMVSPCRTPFLMLILLLSLCRWTDCHRAVGVYFFHKFDIHIFYPLFLKRGQYCSSLHWVESCLICLSRRMRCRVRNCILCICLSVGLRCGCNLSLSICSWIQLALVSGLRRVSSLAFSTVLSWILYRCLIVDISVCIFWGLSYFPKIINILAFFHDVGIRVFFW